MVFEPPQQPETSPPPARPAWTAPSVPVADLEPTPPAARHHWRWAVGLVAAIAIAGAGTLVAASGNSKKSPLAVLTAASGNTTAAGTARFSSAETVSEDGQSVRLLDIDGATDFSNKTSELTMTSRGQRIETIRVLHGVEYLSTDLTPMPNGARWISIRPSDLGLSTKTASPLGSQDPTSGLQFLSAVKSHPRDLGTANIDGTSTTHYAFTVDIETLMERMAKASSKLGSSSLSQGLGALGGAVDLHKVPAQAWIDGSGRVRRFQMTLKFSVRGHSVSSVEVDDFSHFNEPVRIAAPPTSDTVPFSSVPNFFQQLGASTGVSGLDA